MKHLRYRSDERGAVSGLLIALIGLSIFVLGVGSFSIWAYLSYVDANSDVERRIAVAEAEARAEQAEKSEENFTERENKPTHTFLAPDDFCSLTFEYPKNWSEHWSEEVSNGDDFYAYLNPGFVPPISNAQQFGLRVTIEQRDFDNVLQRYDNLVQTGDLKQSKTTSNGHEGTRLTGAFSSYIRGDAVLYKCRDKSIVIRTDSDIFQEEFNQLIRTIDFRA